MLCHHRHASETPCKWCFADGPMVARLYWYLDPLFPQLNKKRFFFFFFFVINDRTDPSGPIASRRMSVPELLRKRIATCDFPGDPDPLVVPLDPPMPSLLVDFIGTKMSCAGLKFFFGENFGITFVK